MSLHPQSGTRSTKPILFVDDDPAVRSAFKRLASAHGFSVDVAPNGDEGLKAARERAYSVIVTDHRMPGLCGSELVARFRALQPEASLILVTGYSDLAVESCRVPGLFVVISKPWDNNALLTLLHAGARQRILETG